MDSDSKTSTKGNQMKVRVSFTVEISAEDYCAEYHDTIPINEIKSDLRSFCAASAQEGLDRIGLGRITSTDTGVLPESTQEESR